MDLIISRSASLITKIRNRLEELVSPEEDRLTEAMHYTLLGPGKHFRPLLVFASGAVFGVPAEPLLDLACAVEMVHAYSLIHDDLPCMDNDDMRRGRPTAHRVFGDAIALLAGDALLTLAFEVLASAPIEPELRMKLIQKLALRAGKRGMVRGQIKDILGTQDILLLFEEKTGDLLSCCLEFGALFAHSTPEQELIMRALGLALGRVYQIRDDLEDADGLLDRTQAGLFLKDSLQEIKNLLSQLPSSALPIETLLTDFGILS